MIQELNLTPAEMKLLFLVLVILLVKLWRHKSYFKLDIEPKEPTHAQPVAKTPELHNANYGAYIQSQGRYYN